MIPFFLFAFYILPIVFAELMPENCQFPINLRGTFFRQLNNCPSKKGPDSLTRVPAFEKFIIEKFVIYPWGRCVQQIGQNSFILRRNYLKNKSSSPHHFMKLPICFRCFTLVKLTENVLQSLHQNESFCHKTLKDAEKSCFDAQKVSTGEGILLFRYPPSNFDEIDFGCELLEGKFKLGYNLKLDMANSADDEKLLQTFECNLWGKSEMSSCVGNLLTNNLIFRFKNCTFPNFEQTFQCIGSWGIHRKMMEKEKGKIEMNNSKFIAFYNIQTQEFRCGIIKRLGEFGIKLFLSIDSSCARMTSNGENALEEFTMSRKYTPLNAENGNSFSYYFNQNCEFPIFLRGRQFTNGLEIGQQQIVHRPLPNKIGVNFAKNGQRKGNEGHIASICVRQEGHERFLVHSTEKCGESLGYHCIWFRQRSDFLVEFRTTGIQSTMNPDICEIDSNQFSPWNALLDINVEQKGQNEIKNVGCGIRGQFSTPRGEWKSGDCFSLEADCSLPNILRLVAFHCQTSEIYEVNEYECLASWHEEIMGENVLYIYTRKIGNLKNSTKLSAIDGLCFASRKTINGLGFKGFDLILLGKNCKRQIEWNGAMALQKKEHCGKWKGKWNENMGNNIGTGMDGNSLMGDNFMASDDYSIWADDVEMEQNDGHNDPSMMSKNNEFGLSIQNKILFIFSFFLYNSLY